MQHMCNPLYIVMNVTPPLSPALPYVHLFSIVSGTTVTQHCNVFIHIILCSLISYMLLAGLLVMWF